MLTVLNLTATESSSWMPIALTLGLILLISLPVWFVVRWYVHPTTPGERKEAITLLFQAVGGTALLLGAYFTWQQLLTSRSELRATEQSQITERFTRAIDQLGKSDSPSEGKSATEASRSNLAIRLGGIYALERIAKDSKEDYSVVMEVLAAFVRENARWSANQENPELTFQGLQPDVQAALTVIGRRTVAYQKDDNQQIDLSGTDLRGAELSRANLNRVDLRATHLEEAILTDTQFEGATLIDARFARAVLRTSNLRKADLRGCDFRGATIDRVDFTDANLSGADLSGVDLHNVVGLTSQQLSSAKTDSKTLLGR
jgi:hypothetical protein